MINISCTFLTIISVLQLNSSDTKLLLHANPYCPDHFKNILQEVIFFALIKIGTCIKKFWIF